MYVFPDHCNIHRLSGVVHFIFFVWKEDSDILLCHAYSMKWKHFPHCWPFVRGIHWSPVNSPHRGQWRGALMFSLICAWLSGWVNSREASDLRRHSAHYDVIVLSMVDQCILWSHLCYYVVQYFACGCPAAPQLHDIGRHSAEYKYIYIYMYVYVCIYVCMCICIYVCICMCVYVCMCVYMYIIYAFSLVSYSRIHVSMWVSALTSNPCATLSRHAAYRDFNQCCLTEYPLSSVCSYDSFVLPVSYTFTTINPLSTMWHDIPDIEGNLCKQAGACFNR